MTKKVLPKSYHTGGEEIPEADYQPTKLPEHAGNPLIEALPSFRLASDMVNAFGRFPDCSEEENKELSTAERMFAVLRLNNWLEPLTAHFELIDQTGLMVRTGYVNRNPLKPKYRKELVKFYREAMDGKIRPIGNSGPSTAPSLSLVGVSGTGKTSVLERYLDFLPEALCHGRHGFVQVVWMKFDCPPDGSLKQLLVAILKKLDRMLGTMYEKELGTAGTNDSLIYDVPKVLASHHLGVLVIDEIQNLLKASGIGQAKMINMLVSYINVAKIPLIVVGTPSALDMLEGTFRVARRVSDHGSFVWDAFPYGEEYLWFLECLSKYQWIMNPVPLHEKLSKTFHKRTQGIHALTVRLSQLSQLRAIRTGTECLTKDLVNQVADDKFKLMAPMLDALRKGNKKVISKYEDLLHKGLKEIDEEVGREARLSLLKDEARRRKQGSFERFRTVSALMKLGFEEGPIQKIVTDLFETDPNLSADKAVRIILESAHTKEGSNGSSKKDSLKNIVQKGKGSGANPMDALGKEGFIPPPPQGV